MTNYKVEDGMSSPIAVKRGGNDAHQRAPIKTMQAMGRSGYVEPRGYEAHTMQVMGRDKAGKMEQKYRGGR